MGMWKLRRIRGGVFKGRYPLCNEEKNEIQILLKCKEIQIVRTIFNDKCLCIKEEMLPQKIINCNKITELTNLDECLYKLKCRWENGLKELCKVEGK